MAVEVVIKKWGNSMGVVLPKQLVEQKHLKTNEKVMIELVKETNLKDWFGKSKTKMTGQQFKDLVREGWF